MRLLLLFGLLLALTSQALAAGRLAPPASTIEVARTLGRAQYRGRGAGPSQTIQLPTRGGVERTIYPGIVVSQRAWTSKGTRFSIVRKDTVIGNQVTQHERSARKATPAERAEAAATKAAAEQAATP